MSVALLLFISVLSFASPPERTKSAAEICVTYLGQEKKYSIVLKDDGSFDFLSGPIVDPKMYVSPERLINAISGGKSLFKNLPELAKLDWARMGRAKFFARAKFAHFRIDKEGILAIEMNLADPNLVVYLVKALENEKVTALITGIRSQVIIERLDSGDASVQRVLKNFLAFAKKNGDGVRDY
jgi:hypothetical protein